MTNGRLGNLGDVEDACLGDVLVASIIKGFRNEGEGGGCKGGRLFSTCVVDKDDLLLVVCLRKEKLLFEACRIWRLLPLSDSVDAS